MLHAMKWLARCRGLRGTAFDPFGHTSERKLERQLIVDHEALVDTVLAGLRAERLDLAVQLARVPDTIRGYGHVKLASVTLARATQKTLLDRFQGRADQAAPAQSVASPPAMRGVPQR